MKLFLAYVISCVTFVAVIGWNLADGLWWVPLLMITASGTLGLLGFVTPVVNCFVFAVYEWCRHGFRGRVQCREINGIIHFVFTDGIETIRWAPIGCIWRRMFLNANGRWCTINERNAS